MQVDVPVDQPARVRFQKFRGLKSLRTSTWDPYEDLPVAYQADTGRAAPKERGPVACDFTVRTNFTPS